MCEEGSQAPRHTVRTTVQFCLWMWVSPGYTIEMCTRLTYPVRKSCVTSNRTMDLLQKHNCTGKLAHARVIGPIRLNSPANMLPRTDAVPQFIHRWRCRLFLRTGPSPAQSECATNPLGDFFNTPFRIAGLQRLLGRQGVSL